MTDLLEKAPPVRAATNARIEARRRRAGGEWTELRNSDAPAPPGPAVWTYAVGVVLGLAVLFGPALALRWGIPSPF